MASSALIIRSILIILLGTCCIFQVKESVEKYFSKSTTSATNFEARESLTPPIIVLCPLNPFKPEETMKENEMSNFQYYANSYKYWPTDSAKVESAWKNITYDLQDLLQSFTINDDDKNLPALMQGQIKDPHLSVTNIDTLYLGRCFAIQYMKNMTYDSYIHLEFKQGQKSFMGVKAYFFDELQILALPLYTFAQNPTEVIVQKGQEISVLINLQELQALSQQGSCSADFDSKNYAECFRNLFTAQLFNQTYGEVVCEKDTFRNCSIPQANYLVKDQSSYCTSIESANCARTILTSTSMKLINPTNLVCSKPCKSVQYHSSINTFLQPQPANTSLLYVAMPNYVVQVVKELLLVDFNEIVSSVGGSMGLFIGFSFLELLMSISQLVGKRLAKCECSLAKLQ